MKKIKGIIGVSVIGILLLGLIGTGCYLLYTSIGLVGVLIPVVGGGIIGVCSVWAEDYFVDRGQS